MTKTTTREKFVVELPGSSLELTVASSSRQAVSFVLSRKHGPQMAGIEMSKLDAGRELAGTYACMIPEKLVDAEGNEISPKERAYTHFQAMQVAEEIASNLSKRRSVHYSPEEEMPRAIRYINFSRQRI